MRGRARLLGLGAGAPTDDCKGDDPVVTIRPADRAGVRIGFAHEHPLVAGESARMRCNPRNHVADLVDPRLEQLRAWRRPVRGRSSPDQHSGGEHWPQPLLQRSTRKRADNSVDLLPVPDHD
jgi:hypothetical protein